MYLSYKSHGLHNKIWLKIARVIGKLFYRKYGKGGEWSNVKIDWGTDWKSRKQTRINYSTDNGNFNVGNLVNGQIVIHVNVW
jgi:hypothetical protein